MSTEIEKKAVDDKIEEKTQDKDIIKEEKTIEIKSQIRFHEKLMIKILRQGHIPKHIAFIMDGNRRFATSHGKKKTEGHFSGFLTFKRCCEWCFYLGVKEMTVFAFAIENFNRHQEEVDVLMGLAEKSLRKLADDGDFLQKYSIKVKICGDIKLLPESVQQAMAQIEELTKNHTSLLLNICFSYNAENEIEHSVATIKKMVNLKN